jgi:hypothetical protein
MKCKCRVWICEPNELGNEFRLEGISANNINEINRRTYVVGEVGVHYDHEISRTKVQTVHIGCPVRQSRQQMG